MLSAILKSIFLGAVEMQNFLGNFSVVGNEENERYFLF